MPTKRQPIKKRSPRTPAVPLANVVEEFGFPQESPAVPASSDYGLYRCSACGKMVLGYDKDNHINEVHGGKDVAWGKMG